jgi:hypothetical protein
LNDASGETYTVEMHTDYPVGATYSIHRRLPGGTWVTIRARLDAQWALDVLTVFMPRPAFKLPLADPLGADEVPSLISEFECVIRLKGEPSEAFKAWTDLRDGEEITLSLHSREYDEAARIIEGDCGLPFAFFPGMTEAQVRAAHTRETSPEEWFIE